MGEKNALRMGSLGRSSMSFFAVLAAPLGLLGLLLLVNLLASPPCFVLRDTHALVGQMLSGGLHIFVCHDGHFGGQLGQVVRPCEREAIICGESARSLCTTQGLFVAT